MRLPGPMAWTWRSSALTTDKTIYLCTLEPTVAYVYITNNTFFHISSSVQVIGLNVDSFLLKLLRLKSWAIFFLPFIKIICFLAFAISLHENS